MPVVGSQFDGVLTDGYLTAAARRTPDALAVVDGERRMSYLELDAAVAAVLHGLTTLGVTQGDVVSWQLPNWHEALVLHHAVLRLGAISNPIIPIYRHREMRFVLTQARSRLVVVPQRFRGYDHASMMDDLRPDLPDLGYVLHVRGDGSFEDLLASKPARTPQVIRNADDPVLLMFTSGTTAEPKGVLHTHATLDYENRSIIEVYGLGVDDVVFMPSPVTHITGLLYGLHLPAMLSTHVVLQDVWDAARALRLIEEEGATFTLAATPFLHGLTYHPQLADYDVSSLRVFACGGADVPPGLIRAAGKRLGCQATRVYGSTEFPSLTTGPLDDPLERRAGTDGRVIGDAEFRILDGDQDVAPGTVGELVVRGPEMFVRYLREADNAGAHTHDGWFRTGDLASADTEGYLTIEGRSKDIIVRGGENISVVEVENLLVEHPSVCQVAAVAMPDPLLGERMCAFVVPAQGTAPTLDELLIHLEHYGLARQKLPERLELVAELPTTASGKVQKFLLRATVRALVEHERDGTP